MLPNLLPITFIVANQKVMSTIRFSLRKDKKLKDGTAPIELVYQIKGLENPLNVTTPIRSKLTTPIRSKLTT